MGLEFDPNIKNATTLKLARENRAFFGYNAKGKKGH